MPLYDFECNACGKVVEEIASVETKKMDCNCGGTLERLVAAPTVLTEIIPSYPGSLKQKAGYVHTHGDRPATKIMSGPGGCTSPE